MKTKDFNKFALIFSRKVNFSNCMGISVIGKERASQAALREYVLKYCENSNICLVIQD